MRERSEQALRMLGLVLGGLLVLQLSLRVIRRDPLANLQIPQLPALTNAPESQPPGKGTNLGSLPPGLKSATNIVSHSTTNASTLLAESKGKTNTARLVTVPVHANSGPTDPVPVSVAEASAESTPASRRGSNVISAAQSTNAINASSNLAAHVPPGTTNRHFVSPATNLMTKLEPNRNRTNLTARSGPPMPGLGPAGPFGPGNKPKDLPPAIQARVDRVVESELLGPVMHPLPMALLGIAGDVAFLRSASGQTGLVKEGDKVGELKLLKIGLNRVLVEQDGKKEELTVFSGYGSESLLPKTQDNSQ